ncbi:MAG TPA: hypothetical protein VH280_05590 [Verrucomicrobiae bacterium]|jgi:hypothetical protein|nr:hypothetical protein [Verrucomicrobiae bacterium]
MEIKTIYGDGNVATCHSVPSLAIGTYGQGAISCRYRHLVQVFGEPKEGDGYKTQAEWTVLTPNGIATIYDWKEGDCYHGEGNGTPVEDVTEWHVGGPNPKVIEWIEKAITKNPMKLYATVASERATKGQGGNDYLKIVIKDEMKTTKAIIDVTNDEFGFVIDYTDCHTGETNRLKEELKGKKQKGNEALLEAADNGRALGNL